jgi:hypothetical protein
MLEKRNRVSYIVLVVLLMVTAAAAFSQVGAETRSYSGDEVMKMATGLADKIDQAKMIPNEAEIAKNKISIEDTVYLMAKWLELYGQSERQQAEIPKAVAFLDADKPVKFANGAIEGTITWQNLYKSGKDAAALLDKSPKLFEGMSVLVTKGEATTETVVSSDVLIYVWARTLRWVANNNQMPNYTSIRSVASPKF